MLVKPFPLYIQFLLIHVCFLFACACNFDNSRVGTLHIKVFSDIHIRVGTLHMKKCSDDLTKAGTPHTYILGCGDTALTFMMRGPG